MLWGRWARDKVVQLTSLNKLRCDTWRPVRLSVLKIIQAADQALRSSGLANPSSVHALAEYKDRKAARLIVFGYHPGMWYHRAAFDMC